MTTIKPPTRIAGAARRRLAIGAGAAVLVGADLVIKTWSVATLTQPVDLGPLQLRLAYNTGMAFSFGAALPSWVILTLTGLLAAGIAVAAWRAARTSRVLSVGLAMVLAGAVANLIDRAGDGRVTDYLHTGWWPTFNLADVLITCGAAVIVLATLRSPQHGTGGGQGDRGRRDGVLGYVARVRSGLRR